MKAATCVADITPKCAVHLCGYVGEARKYTAKGIHDHPLAVSLLLEIDGVRLLFISIDVITLGGEKADVSDIYVYTFATPAGADKQTTEIGSYKR